MECAVYNIIPMATTRNRTEPDMKHANGETPCSFAMRRCHFVAVRNSFNVAKGKGIIASYIHIYYMYI